MSVSGIAYRAVTLPAEIEGYSQLEAVEAVGEGERLGDGGCDKCAGRQKDVVKKDHNERKSDEVKTVIARKRTSRRVGWRVWPITCWRMEDCISCQITTFAYTECSKSAWGRKVFKFAFLSTSRTLDTIGH